MIDSNLAVLLAERNLRITKVSKDTGISRTTLTSLCYDHTAGVKFDTLEKLCMYLGITPAEFFNYSPYTYKIEQTSFEPTSEEINKKHGFIIGFEMCLHIVGVHFITTDLPFYIGVVDAVLEDPSQPYDEIKNRYATLNLALVNKAERKSEMDMSAPFIAEREFKRMYSSFTHRQQDELRYKIMELLEDPLNSYFGVYGVHTPEEFYETDISDPEFKIVSIFE